MRAHPFVCYEIFDWSTRNYLISHHRELSPFTTPYRVRSCTVERTPNPRAVWNNAETIGKQRFKFKRFFLYVNAVWRLVDFASSLLSLSSNQFKFLHPIHNTFSFIRREFTVDVKRESEYIEITCWITLLLSYILKISWTFHWQIRHILP